MTSAASTLPETFPESWAESYGQDEFGLWQGVYVGEEEVRFRWIPPGLFLMGSPEDEPGRWDAEGPQHEVTFDQGFWLAETACTQALWQAVMGENPSKFKDDPQNPVENVGWEKAQPFIDKLNRKTPALRARLPREAEWEYACRAGSTTPFWWGSELTTDQANYNGNYPYNKGKKGEYRKRTVPARYFRPNPWGLYQMHGNVWEWCQDRWHESYKGAPADGQPWEAGDSQNHVCRGGSWYDRGGSLRSACRRYGWRGFVSYGLRLARGPESSSRQAAAAAVRGQE